MNQVTSNLLPAPIACDCPLTVPDLTLGVPLMGALTSGCEILISTGSAIDLCQSLAAPDQSPALLSRPAISASTAEATMAARRRLDRVAMLASHLGHAHACLHPPRRSPGEI